MSAKEFLEKSRDFILRRIKRQYLRICDRYNSTYVSSDASIVPIIYEHLDKCDIPEYTMEAADLHLRHCFDLLGSGWVRNGFGESYAGCEGYCYDMQLDINADKAGKWLENIVPETCLRDAQSVWQCILGDYQPIDWQMDFKSGYRWSAKTWYMDMEYGHLPGVDIKVPWELSRMQHLVQYAYAYMQAASECKEKYVSAYRNEILDFIAQNPPRYGVCWRCTMDVGIRVANWLLAYDLFCSLGVQFDEKFKKILADAVYAHGIHIINNLEYSPQLTSNHYLSDIGGLVFAAVHLASVPEADAWLAFGMQELVSEMEREFHEDGSNFEASTSYHCLSTEIMLYTACLCRNLSAGRRKKLKKYQKKYIKQAPFLRDYGEQKFDLEHVDIFPMEFWQRLARALQFIEDISDENGHIQQIGDMDSGRFLKLSPVYDRLTGSELRSKYFHLIRQPIYDKDFYFDDDMLNFSHLTRQLQCFKSPEYIKADNSIDGIITHQKGNLPYVEFSRENIQSADWKKAKKDALRLLSDDYASIAYKFPSDKNLLEDLRVKEYPGMGIYIFLSRNMRLIARCGEIGQNGNGGHCHNDQLSICLCIDGKQLIDDAGSYLYTPAPEMRNKFRSVLMHFTPWVEGLEQNSWAEGAGGLFSLQGDRAKARVIAISNEGIIMAHDGYGKPIYRIVELSSHMVSIRDYGVGLTQYRKRDICSNGYGKLLRH